MHALASVLDAAHLPLPERMAARLDGELFALGGAHCPIDAVETPELRLTAALAGFPDRLIGELGTAAWVWGATDLLPQRLELCVDLGARARASGPVHIREVVLGDDDVTRFGLRRVTTPLRTAIDLARFRPRFDGDEAAVVRTLARVGRFDLATCRAVLDARRNLPAKRRAHERLAWAFAAGSRTPP